MLSFQPRISPESTGIIKHKSTQVIEVSKKKIKDNKIVPDAPVYNNLVNVQNISKPHREFTAKTVKTIFSTVDELYQHVIVTKKTKRTAQEISKGIDAFLQGLEDVIDPLKSINLSDTFENKLALHYQSIQKKWCVWLELADNIHWIYISEATSTYTRLLIEMTPIDQKKVWLKRLVAHNVEGFEGIKDGIGYQLKEGFFRKIGIGDTLYQKWEKIIDKLKDHECNTWLLHCLSKPKGSPIYLKGLEAILPQAFTEPRGLGDAILKELEDGAAKQSTSRIIESVNKHYQGKEQGSEPLLWDKSLKQALYFLFRQLETKARVQNLKEKLGTFVLESTIEAKKIYIEFQRSQNKQEKAALFLGKKLSGWRLNVLTTRIKQYLDQFEQLEACSIILEKDQAQSQEVTQLKDDIKNHLQEIFKESKPISFHKKHTLGLMDSRLLQSFKPQLKIRRNWLKHFQSLQYEIEEKLGIFQPKALAFFQELIHVYKTTLEDQQLELHTLLYGRVKSIWEMRVYSSFSNLQEAMPNTSKKFILDLENVLKNGGFKLTNSSKVVYQLEAEFVPILQVILEDSSKITTKELFQELKTTLQKGHSLKALFRPESRECIFKMLLELFHPGGQLSSTEALRFTMSQEYATLEIVYDQSKCVQKNILEMTMFPEKNTPINQLFLAKSICVVDANFNINQKNRERFKKLRRIS